MLSVLFVCVHNAGRSQMAAALFNHLCSQRGLPFRADSAGTHPAERVNPAAVEALRELGIDLSAERPRQLTQSLADSAGRIVTMGCGVDATACPARFLVSEDWGLDDPAGQPIETVRRIRDEILDRVERLIRELEAERG
ncbi:MAG: arsenate reductase ArsC [Fimbriimonadales bacterium]|nr:arsenate reductase ArsC [Fimbriimonadales bacterium]